MIDTDYQRVKIQEIDNGLADAGRVPRTVEVELSDDSLVDTCIPGDLITVVGIVKTINASHAAGKVGKRAATSSLFLLYIQANSVCNNRVTPPILLWRKPSPTANLPEKVHGSGGCQTLASSETFNCFTAESIRAIRMIADDGDAFNWLVSSICPSIFGNERIKLAIALSLFGGSKADVLAQGLRTNRYVLLL